MIVMSNIVALAAPNDDRDWNGLVDANGNLQDTAISTEGTAILVDAKTGKILYSDESNLPMHPASITKINDSSIGTGKR